MPWRFCFECLLRIRHKAVIQRGDRTPVAAQITRSISRDHLHQAVRWVPELHEQGADDATWDWEAKLQSLDPDGRYEGCALVRGRQVQGLMLLESALRRSRQTQRPLVYVEFLAVAPWNRRSPHAPQRFGHCGTALMEYAEHRSVIMGLRGRLGLHSLPSAEIFYRRAGLRDFGADSQERGLRYFESPEPAIQSDEVTP